MVTDLTSRPLEKGAFFLVPNLPFQEVNVLPRAQASRVNVLN
ncbi:hypothetical protein MITS9509_02827 [Synechococcus sp. MIT S9509]|nr:hypothetical protein MITS9504_02535 [Synechococcus sp. MIT S9504]KZR90142.1 hypothetical protein MITS9509_02827 [Synechococcus sp. MIT S9509]